MNRTVLNIAIFAAIGLVLGYAFFGKWGGDYVSLNTLFSFGGNKLQTAFRSVSGIEDMRNKILICGAVGAAVGAAIAFKK
ncbi:MAG: hypothetical protein KJ795_12175 [Gammaproteobacteria bacterium]|nr:hypothetical protein [Gammaproteobacteria bacterium]MBU1775630.1 hypothetical protein [Gammaproteobacteria bacterium]MBU1968773.1 hypothetical protein [Gammaproteobacteria bacterium]